MGRPETAIDPTEGPLQEFSFELRKLRREAGNPTYREMARRVSYSVAALSEAARGTRRPTLEITRAFARACGGDLAYWEERWRQLATDLGVGQVRSYDPVRQQHRQRDRGPTRWLICGAGGLLGRELTVFLRECEQLVSALPRSELDITDPVSCARAVRDCGVDVVVNAAAWTAPDDAETDEGRAFMANAFGPAVLARACEAAGVRLVHISSDYVFHEPLEADPGGPFRAPYGEDHLPHPSSAYGRTKAAGEWAVRSMCADHLIVRTAWLYGKYGRCFPRTIVGRLRADGELRVVADQFGQPTWARDVAALITDLVRAPAPAGTYHATAAGWTSWYEFARVVVASCGADPALVKPATTAEIGRRAPRPTFSALGHDAVHQLAAAGLDVAAIGRWRERWTQAGPQILPAIHGLAAPGTPAPAEHSTATRYPGKETAWTQPESRQK